MSSSTAVTPTNPLVDGLPLRRRPAPCTIVIFGASGDLTLRKLMPALYSLAFRHLLPEHFTIVGAARTPGSDDGFREAMKQAVQQHSRDEFRQDIWDELCAGIRYAQLDDDEATNSATLTELCDRIDRERGTQGNRLYYFAVPPSAIGPLVETVAEVRSTTGWNRLIIEKPFGHDLDSARELNHLIAQHFTESEVFRIDHYLGKETVQNLLALRFANGIFEPIWNRQFIDHVQITVAESIGIEGRAGVLRAGGRDPRHLPEPPAAAARDHGDGAAERLHRRFGAQREGQGAPLAAHARAEVGRARPVRARLRRGGRGARLPRGGGRRGRLGDRDVRRREAVRRQLALGRHAVLRPDGQAAAAPRDDDRDPVQARASSAVRGDRGRGACARTCC